MSHHNTNHAGESGVQLSVGVEIEAYGDWPAAASNNFMESLGTSQASNTAIANIEWTTGKVITRSFDS